MKLLIAFIVLIETLWNVKIEEIWNMCEKF